MKSDLLRVIEAGYAEIEDEELWLRGIVGAAAPVLDAGCGLVAFCYRLERRAMPRLSTLVEHDGVGITKALIESAIRTAPSEVARNAFAVNRVSTLTEYLASPDLNSAPFLAAPLQPIGVHDSIGIVGINPCGRGIVLNVGLAQPRRLAPSFRRSWQQLLAHLAAALRLRTASAADEHPSPMEPTEADTTEAVLDLSGRVHDAIGAARERPAQAALRQAARAIDRAKAKRSQDPEGAVALWRALVGARWSLVDQFESDGRHFLIARRNPLNAPAVRALSESERRVVALAALGRSNKLIGYELGLSTGTVGTLLSRASRKLGVSSRVRLIETWSRLECEQAD